MTLSCVFDEIIVVVVDLLEECHHETRDCRGFKHMKSPAVVDAW